MAANWTDFVSGAVLTAAQLNGVLDNFQDLAIFNETQASGTQSGSSVSGSMQKRTLNTTVVNNITGCTLTSSVIALPAGTYSVTAFQPFHASNAHKTQLRNTTDSTTAILGNSGSIGSALDATVFAILQGVFTIAATKNFELQYQVANAVATNGLGQRANFAGLDEVYATIQIARIA